ncbi:MAG: hypothetical protein J6S85_19980 [Methanobrevibacter sp.]|nr:hypothetical protein [Methanobrevibacter sp.]
MSKLRDLERQVKEILKANPSTRGDDDLLYDNLLQNMKVDLSKFSVRSFLLTYRKMGIPTIESVGRCRRKIQSKDESLKPTADIILNRKRLENSYYCYSLGIKEV